MRKKISAFLLLFSFYHIFSQNATPSDSISRKKIVAVKTSTSPKIDGILDDDIWSNANEATNFIERRPQNGNKIPSEFFTSVKVAYDDTGVYFGARMDDPEASKISKELTERDQISNDDIFGVTINGYNDKQQSLEFLITPAGVQADGKITTDMGEDMTWNGVWFSAVNIDEKGWTVEMKIPYSELRFPKKNVQEWGINFLRLVQRNNTMYDWNFVNNNKGSYMLYDGILNGIENIEPPVRLSFTPYFSTYLNSYDGDSKLSVNGGMDLKYGINDAFTLDLTLIPDFGQTNFDNSILNLSPFEQQFEEQRPFFTEGTELFSKGDLFYSRRVGGYPSKSAELEDDEILLEDPQKVKLFNAFKISGRTNKGLGIGIFNGITEKAEAKILNESTGETRKETLEPWANYNVLVFDQRFNENSSVSLINTNTMRSGSFRDANATGLLWDISNKKNTYNYFGNLKGSWVMEDGTKFGTRGQAGFGKFSGKNRFEFSGLFVTEDWDINDLGFSTSTNYANYKGWYGYRILQPTEKFNNIYVNFNLNYIHRLEPYLYSKLEIYNNTQFTNKKFQSYGFGVETTPIGEKDIYEPRTAGRHLNVPGYFDSWIWFESDSRKKLMFNFSLDYYAYYEKGRNLVAPFAYFRYRFSDKWKVIYQLSPRFSNNEVGYAGESGSTIYMGKRQRNTYENYLYSQYSLNDKMTFSLTFRHYFSDVTYKGFYTLDTDGDLTPTSDFTDNLNGTYNSWNIDLRYSWWFAPGSQLTLLYRNATSNYLDQSRLSIGDNFNELFNEPMLNNFSLKFTYYLDYNRVKHAFKSKKGEVAFEPRNRTKETRL